MNFWMKLKIRWNSEELYKYSSMFRVAYILLPLMIYYLAGDVTEVILMALLNITFANKSQLVIENVTRYGNTIQGIIYGIGLIVACIILRNIAKNEICYDDGEIKSKINFKNVISLIAIALVSSLGLNILFNITGIVQSSEGFKQVNSTQYSVNLLSGLLLYGICSPIAEEILFRGIIYNRLKRIFPTIASVIISSLMFGVFHGNVVQGLYGFIMGVIIALAYEKLNDFASPVIIHVVANVSVYLFSSFVWK